ncbi:uncharacterized protein MONBRDRAFT_30480, partial [Monosiga brevicollis MX1]
MLRWFVGASSIVLSLSVSVSVSVSLSLSVCLSLSLSLSVSLSLCVFKALLSSLKPSLSLFSLFNSSLSSTLLSLSMRFPTSQAVPLVRGIEGYPCKGIHTDGAMANNADPSGARRRVLDVDQHMVGMLNDPPAPATEVTLSEPRSGSGSSDPTAVAGQNPASAHPMTSPRSVSSSAAPTVPPDDGHLHPKRGEDLHRRKPSDLFQVRTAEEWYTPEQLAALRKPGKRNLILSTGERIDYILAYYLPEKVTYQDLIDMMEDPERQDNPDAHIAAKRLHFEVELVQKGLVLEHELGAGDKVVFVKIHTPFKVLCARAEKFQYKMPLRESRK